MATQVGPDLAAAVTLHVGYMPVVWPGFSWANLQHDPGVFNQIPRLGGRFFWRQLQGVIGQGATTVYVAMFDEVDEGTAIFKAASTQQDVPTQGAFLSLDADGEAIASDWYLRLTGAATKTLAGQVPSQAALPLK